MVDALLEVLGPEGTIAVPTFNFEPGVFDSDQTPSIVGEITEAVRNPAAPAPAMSKALPDTCGVPELGHRS